MAGGFKIPFIADVAKFIKGTDNMADALEDVSDSLDDLGKNKGIEKLEDGFQDAGKEAKDLDRKVSEAFDNIAKDAKRTGDKVAREVKDGTDKAGAGFNELKDEAAGTARESAASFASIEDAAGALQEVAANALAGFGPAGMAAGIVVAAGIGLGVSALTDHADKVNENKEKMLGLAQTIRDNGGALREADYIAAMEDYGYAIQDTKEWFEIFQASAVSGFDKIRDIADKTRLSTSDVLDGGFGDIDKAREKLKIVREDLEKLREKKEAVYQTTGAILEPVDSDALDSLEDAERLIEDNIQAQEDAQAIERVRREAIEGTTQALKEDNEAKEAAEDAEKDLAQYVEGTTENLLAKLDATRELTDATKDSIITDLDYRDGVEELNTKLTENGLTVDANTAKGRDNQRAILDQAGVIADLAAKSLEAGESTKSVTDKFNAQKDALITQVTPAFGGSREAARLYIEQVLKTPPAAKTKVALEGVPAARAELEGLASPITVPLRPGVEQTYFQSALRQLSGISIPVSLTPRAGQSLP